MKEELIKLFCSKVNLELSRYKKRILQMPPEEIYGNSYQIECIVNIGDCLVEKSEKLSEDILRCLLVLPNLLGFFYYRWMKVGDSFQQELEESLNVSIQEISGMAGIREEAA